MPLRPLTLVIKLEKWTEKNHVKRLRRDFKLSKTPKEVAKYLHTLKQNLNTSYLKETPDLK